jgi:hypothetical protein
VSPDEECADRNEVITLPDYFANESLEYIDFIKVDTDGDDIRVITSLDGAFDDMWVLGLSVEVNFFGSARGDANTLHNIDRLLKGAGFELFDLSVRRYTTRYLPGRFVGDSAGPTAGGRVLQGDALYARDLVNVRTRHARDWTPTHILKLCCVFDLFGLPDCAAELLVEFREELREIVDARTLLDRLVPARFGRRVRYDDFVAAFRRGDHRFYRRRPLVSIVNALPSTTRERLLVHPRVGDLRRLLSR